MGCFSSGNLVMFKPPCTRIHEHSQIFPQLFQYLGWHEMAQGSFDIWCQWLALIPNLSNLSCVKAQILYCNLWEFRLLGSLVQHELRTAMKHTYDLCEGTGHWFSLAGFFCPSSESLACSAVSFSTSCGQRWNIPMICAKEWVIDFPLPAFSAHPVRVLLVRQSPSVRAADSDETYLWSVWRNGSLIFPCRLFPPIRWEFCLFGSLLQYGLRTAMKHTYDLCEGTGHWFSLAGFFRISGESFACSAVSFSTRCWRRDNIWATVKTPEDQFSREGLKRTLYMHAPQKKTKAFKCITFMNYSWWSILASLDCRDPKPFSPGH